MTRQIWSMAGSLPAGAINAVMQTVGPPRREGIGGFPMQAAPPPHEWAFGDTPGRQRDFGALSLIALLIVQIA